MHQNWKRIISVFLVAGMILGLTPLEFLGQSKVSAAVPLEVNRTLYPTEDTYIDGGVPTLPTGETKESMQAKSFGGSSVIGLYGYNDNFNETSETNHRIGFMKFDLSQLGDYDKAVLRMYCTTNCTITSDRFVSVYKISNDSWDENTLNWDNRTDFPLGSTTSYLNSILLTKTWVGNGAGWYEWDLTDYIKSQQQTDGIASIALRSQNQKVYFASSNTTTVANRPYLFINTDRNAPVSTGATVSGENAVIGLQYDEPVLNNLANASALKAAVTMDVYGTGFQPLAPNDSVTISGSTVTVALESRLAVPGAKIRMAAGALKDGMGNATAEAAIALQYDADAPVLSRSEIGNLNKLVTMEFNEDVMTSLADADALKAAISISQTNGSYAPLAAGDTVSLSSRQLVLAFGQAIPDGMNIRIAAGALKDAAGNRSELVNAIIHLDFEPPVFQGASLYAVNKRVSLRFNESLAAATTNLKAAVTIDRDGNGYVPLGTSDRAQLINNSLILDLQQGVTGQVRVKVAAGALKDQSNNVRTGVTETELLSSSLPEYNYPGFHTNVIEKAMTLNMKTIADRGVLNAEYRKFTVLATELSRGDRSPDIVQAFTGAVRKMVTEYDYVPDVFGGLDARSNIYLTYGLALVWPHRDIMDLFTETEKSKLITLLKAELVSSAYVLSGKGPYKPRSSGASRPEMDGGTNSWPQSAPNYMEPLFGVMFSAQMILGLAQSDDWLRTYNHTNFISELDAQGLTRIHDAFAKTAATDINLVVRNASWYYTNSDGKTVTMKQLLEDPIQVFAVMEQFNFVHPAEEGYYMGQVGMAKEFHSSDSGGNRESSVYSRLGIDPALLNRSLFEYYGYYDNTSYPEARELIEQRQKIGLDDYYTKMVNGYFTVSSTSAKMYYADNDLMTDFTVAHGLVDLPAWNDTFNYDLAATDPTFSLESKWNLRGGSWAPLYKTIVPYNIKKSANTKQPTGLTDPSERVLKLSGMNDDSVAYSKMSFKDISYMAWLQFNSANEVGLLGRVVDDTHYYSMAYDNTRKKVAIKKRNGDTVTTLVEAAYALDANRSYRFQVDMSGGNLKLSINGDLLLTAADNEYVQGGIGFIGRQSDAYFDAVVVKNLVPTPPELQSIVAGDGELTLNYSKIPDAVSYNIHYGIEPGHYTQVLNTRRPLTTTVPDLVNDTKYYFAISSVTPDGESGLSNEMSLTPLKNTTVQPSLLGITSSGNRLAVNFTTDPVNKSYIIQYGMSPGVYTSQIEGVTASGYEVPISFSEEPYYFTVTAVNETGISQPSNEASGQANAASLYEDNFDAGYGGNWAVKTGFTWVNTGQIRSISSGLSRTYLAAGFHWRDYSVSTKAKYTGTSLEQMFVTGRVTDINNYYFAGYYTGEYVIYSKVGGTLTKLASVPAEVIKTGDEILLRAEFTGNRIRLYVNGNFMVEAMDSSLPEGTAGLMTNRTEVAFDEMVVSAGSFNKPPELIPVLPLTVSSGESVTFNVYAQDADGDSLEYRAVSGGTLGSLTVIDSVNGVFVYTPFTGSFGTDTVTYSVYDGKVSVSGTVNVIVRQKVPASSGLRGLSVSSGILTPVFDPKVTQYSVNVANSVLETTVTAQVYDSLAVLSINGKIVADGQGSVTIPLQVGDNTIMVDVATQDSTTKRYTVIVHREPPVLEQVIVTPSSKVLKPGDTSVLAISGLMSDGSAADLSQAQIAYSSNNVQAAVSDGSGVVKAIGEGTAIIKATVSLWGVSKEGIFTVVVDGTPPSAVITYKNVLSDSNVQTVVATMTPSEPVTITNNGGSTSYTFYLNSSFTFEFTDASGNKGSATAIVNNMNSNSKSVPGKPVLSDDSGYDTGLQDGNYKVSMNMWYGNNGNIYKLYENDKLIDTKILKDNSPTAQSTVTSITYKLNGTYSYYAELINEYGTTKSDTHIVQVTQATPGKAVLSSDNWDGDGNYHINLNLWWGTNGTTYRLYENGVLIDTQNLVDRTPNAQSVVSTLVNKSKGTYEYRAEIVNFAGITSSDPIKVQITK